MIIPHDFAHDLGRLAVGPVVRQPHLVHAVQDAPVHGFQPVTDVRQGATDDHAHGVIHVRQAHLVFDGDLSETFFGGHRGWGDRGSWRLHVQPADFQRVLLDEIPSRLDFITHENGENLVHARHVFEFHL